MFLLYKLKSHFVITLLIFINMVYNLSVPFAFFDRELVNIYYAKDAVVRTIMVLELMYLGWLCEYVNFQQRMCRDLDLDRIDRLFCVRGWNINRSWNST